MMHTFENFQKIVDNAIMVEHARKEMGEQKRMFESPRKEHLSTLEDRMSTTGIINTSAPTNITSSNKLSVLVSQHSAPVFCRIARTPLLGHLRGTTPLFPLVVICA
jgi:hypothetical protein